MSGVVPELTCVRAESRGDEAIQQLWQRLTGNATRPGSMREDNKKSLSQL